MPSFASLAQIAIAAFAMAAPSSAAALTKRVSFTTTCDAARNPNWGDCKYILKSMDQTSGGDPNYHWVVNNAQGMNCQEFIYGNCQINICAGSNKGYVENYLVTDASSTLQTQCYNNAAGGEAMDNDHSMYLQIYASQGSPSKMAKRSGSWSNAYTIQNAAPAQYKQQVLNSQPGGSSWTLTSSQTQTNRVESSTSIDADLFETFKASESITYEYTKTVTTSSTSTITNNCAHNQQGTLYWYPLFTQYHGGFSGGPSPVDIYIPVQNSDGSAAGKYTVVCSN